MLQLDRSETDGTSRAVRKKVAEVAGSAPGLGYERCGPEILSDVDRRRLREDLHNAADRSARLCGLILVHDTGARWLGPDDLVG